MLLKNLINGMYYRLIKGDENIDITGIAYDSRKVRQGSLFVCIKGYVANGHSYISNAIENGAQAILVQEDVSVPGDNVAVIKVDDTRFGLAYISNKYFNEPSKTFNLIGVTGTKGKTTITYMIKSILKAAGQNIGLIGTIGNSIGDNILPTERTTPESYDLQQLFSEMKQNSIDTAIMEVSSHALELHRVSCSNFNIGVFTNLSRDHMDFHQNFENYFNSKVKLFRMCEKGLVNIDSSYGKQIIRKAHCSIMTYGIYENADIRAINIKYYPDSVIFNVKVPFYEDAVKVGIPGEFSVYNALAAIGVCSLMNIPFKFIKQGLENIKVPGRAEIINIGKEYSIMIDYAHSPDSLENILSTVKEYAEGRIICLFGCGGDRDKTKRPIMGEISAKYADLTVITNDNPRTEEPRQIISDIEEGIKKTKAKYIIIEDRKDAIKYAILNAKPKDIIILAGKGHETYQIFKDKTVHFDEREVIRDILNEIEDTSLRSG